MPFRQLLESFYEDWSQLEPWAREHGPFVRALLASAQAVDGRWPAYDPEQSALLYALSRVEQVVTQAGRWDWLSTLGLEPFRPTVFHPFTCEIVQVENLGNAAPELLAVEWPGWRAGNLLIARAGCHVRSGPGFMLQSVAENSTLYWAYRRARHCEDPSHGWGSNSQWATAFRRDYELDGRLYYNVDARQQVSQEHRIELVRHRCYLTAEHAWDFPYEDGFTEVSAGTISPAGPCRK